MNAGQLTVRNISGGALSLRGHSVEDGATVDLVRPSAPGACCFYSHTQAKACWSDDGSWLGAMRVAGDLELVLDEPLDVANLS